MKEKTLEIEKITNINFYNKGDFAESIVYYNDCLYIPINNEISFCGLYEYNFKNDTLKKIVSFTKKSIILGSKIENDIFVGCNTYDSSLMVCDLLNKTCYSIDLKKYGCPNDIVFSTIKHNTVYIACNENKPGLNGNLIEVNFITKKINAIKLKYKLESVSGINIYNNYIYLACLTKIYKINVNNINDITIICDKLKLKPLFDNITIYNNLMNIAIYEYGNFMEYTMITNKLLLNIFTYSMYYLTGDLLLFDKKNINRKMNDAEIKFIQMNINTQEKYLITFDKIIDNFDKEVTQISQINENKYILINWKANKFIIVDTKKLD